MKGEERGTGRRGRGLAGFVEVLDVPAFAFASVVYTWIYRLEMPYLVAFGRPHERMGGDLHDGQGTSSGPSLGFVSHLGRDGENDASLLRALAGVSLHQAGDPDVSRPSLLRPISGCY